VDFSLFSCLFQEGVYIPVFTRSSAVPGRLHSLSSLLGFW
jgi:hypothetical protein